MVHPFDISIESEIIHGRCYSVSLESYKQRLLHLLTCDSLVQGNSALSLSFIISLHYSLAPRKLYIINLWLIWTPVNLDPRPKFPQTEFYFNLINVLYLDFVLSQYEAVCSSPVRILSATHLPYS